MAAVNFAVGLVTECERFRTPACDDPIHVRRRQAYEKRQWTKSRLVGRRRRRGLYPGLIGVPALMLVDGTSPDDVDGPSSEGCRRRPGSGRQRTQPGRAGTALE